MLNAGRVGCAGRTLELRMAAYSPPERSGIGVELNEEALAPYRVG